MIYKYLIFSILSLTPFLCQSADSKGSREAKNKADSEAKFIADTQAAAEERADELQAKNRWVFRFDDKNQESYWLHNSEKPATCKGNLRAIKSRWQMNTHELIKELCWSKKQGDTSITLVDPSAYLIKTEKIDAALFKYIPSNKERKAAEAEERSQRILEGISRWSEENRKSREKMMERLMPIPVMIID